MLPAPSAACLPHAPPRSGSRRDTGSDAVGQHPEPTIGRLRVAVQHRLYDGGGLARGVVGGVAQEGEAQHNHAVGLQAGQRGRGGGMAVRGRVVLDAAVQGVMRGAALGRAAGGASDSRPLPAQALHRHHSRQTADPSAIRHKCPPPRPLQQHAPCPPPQHNPAPGPPLPQRACRENPRPRGVSRSSS